ncbi:MAG: 2-succinyl-5-enolpyruvyl-6-hydroxy-3-cyclohexene-1-carboxylic-acid synthase [SAR324 cluster bacterium]|nr:2-succinyl-5-enolpyruvyl-6-hydroxy-3-cyclohexene-1-carboxylic-acid synthase [SAR324 cluster bacterium]
MSHNFPQSFSTLNSLWGALIVEELFRCGVTHFCICPGSRSTPLTHAAASHTGIKTTIHFDERGMAFYALGLAQNEKSKAVAIITTSGTAVPNLFPATVEAAESGLPLLLITGDRPPELLDTGANQAIDQHKIFEGYLQWHATLPCPSPEIDPSMVLTTVDQAVYRSLRKPGGPVHLNCMFREPFLLEKHHTFQEYLHPIKRWQTRQIPFTSHLKNESLPRAEERLGFIQEKIKGKKGIIITGALHSIKESQSIEELAQALKWPIFADITSNLRMKDVPEVLPYYDLMLLNPAACTLLKEAESIIQFGLQLTSKRLLDFLKGREDLDLIVVADNPSRHDPSHRVSVQIEADIQRFCQALLPALPLQYDNNSLLWLQKLQSFSKQIGDELNRYFVEHSELTEPAVARLLSKCSTEGNRFFVGNSMPIRLMNMFAAVCSSSTTVKANRGASGIDGIVATGAGYAVESPQPTTLLLGDLSMLHDMNSLNLVRKSESPFVIVVLNNDGGGIFSMLPIFQQSEIFEKYFQTPHSLEFEQVAKMFGIAYQHPRTCENFEEIYLEALSQNHATLIEISTSFQETNRVIHFFAKSFRQPDYFSRIENQ